MKTQMTNRENDFQRASLADNVTGSTLRAFADGRASMRKEIAERLRALDCYSMPYSIVALIEELEAP